MNPTGICRGRGTDGRVLLQPGDAIPPAGCFTRRSLQIYIHGTVPPPTADERETESEPEDRAEAETALAESNHSIRPETEREQGDRDEIESDHFIQVRVSFFFSSCGILGGIAHVWDFPTGRVLPRSPFKS